MKRRYLRELASHHNQRPIFFSNNTLPSYYKFLVFIAILLLFIYGKFQNLCTVGSKFVNKSHGWPLRKLPWPGETLTVFFDFKLIF